MQSPTPPTQPADSGHASLPQDSAPADPQSQLELDYLTGRYGDVRSVLGEKREVEGVYAHHLDNGKATRSEKILHPPPLQLSQKYESEVRPPRKKYFLQSSQQTGTQPQPAPRLPPRSLTRHSTGRLIARRGPLPQSSGAPVTMPSTAFTYQATLPPTMPVPQVGESTSLSDRFVHPDVIAAVKRASYDWHGDQGIMDDNIAYQTWLTLTEDQRRCVVEHYNKVRMGSTSQPKQGGPSAPQSHVLDQLLMEVDQRDQTFAHPILEPMVYGVTGVSGSPQVCPQQHPAASATTWGASSTDGPAGVSGSVHPYQYPPTAQAFVGAPGSMHVEPPQLSGDASGIAQGGPPAPAFVSASGSTHAEPPQPSAHASGFAAMYSAPAQSSQPSGDASGFAQGGPPAQAFVGASGSMHAELPQPSAHASGFAAMYSAPAQSSQPSGDASGFAQGGPPAQAFVGASGSMHAELPQPSAHASGFAAMYPAPAQSSQPSGEASGFAQGGPPAQAFVGAFGSMHAEPPRLFRDASGIVRGGPPAQAFVGAPGSMHAEPPQPSGDASVEDMSWSLHAPAPQQYVNTSGLMLGASQEQQLGPAGYVATTLPPPRGSAQPYPHPPLPFPDDIDMGVSLEKGKGRADVPSTGHDVMTPERPHNAPQINIHQHRPRLPFMGGLQGDVSGHMNPNTTLLFAQQLRGLASAIEDQTQEFRDFRERFQPVLSVQTPPTSTDPTSLTDTRGATSGGRREAKLQDVSLRMRKREKRIESKVTRLRGAKANTTDSSDEEPVTLNDEVLSKHLNRLRARMRRTFDELLHITDWDDIYHLFPALTTEELVLYKARDARIVPTATNFRVDFCLGWKKPFNKEAREVFIDRYLERVENGAYAKHPTPPQLLTRDRIGDILDKQMPNYRQKWRRSKTPLSAEKKKQVGRAACQRSRKRTLHESREALLVRRGLTRHVRFFKLLEPVNMSGDETDGEAKTHPPKWRILVARWQSAALKNFLWEIDRMYREDWGHPPHKRATGGNPPRDRVHRADCYEDGVAPIGLWRNCYDETWLEALAPHVVRELEIVDEDYDFML